MDKKDIGKLVKLSQKVCPCCESDTEVILAAFQEFGNKSFSMFNGMFALAIYDNIEDILTLARDSFGIKPL